MNEPVALYQLSDYHAPAVREALCQIIAQLGGLNRFTKADQCVLIKPNIICARPQSQTHPVIIIELAKIFREFGCRVAIADSPAWGSIPASARRSGLLQLVREAEIPLFDLKQPVKVETPRGSANKHLTISKQVLEADVIINVPKLKAHQQLKLTAGVKNIFGVVPGKRKALWHHKAATKSAFTRMIVETYLLVKPSLTIIDAIKPMHGPGPIRGDLCSLGAIIGSPDPFAAELVAARLVNCDPATLPLVRAGWELQVAPENPDRIEVIGADPETLTLDKGAFVFPEQIPIRFSLPRILKSTLKQISLICRERWRER